MHISLNNKDKFRLYNLLKILSSFLISVLVSGWNWSMNFQKIVPSAFRPFIGHHQGLLTCVRCICFFLKSFESF